MKKNHKKYILVIFIPIILLLVGYLSYSVFITFQVNDLINKAMDDKPYDEVQDLIGEFDYELINPRDIELEKDENGARAENLIIESKHSFVYVFPFISNMGYYEYKYCVINKQKPENDPDRIIYGDGSDFDWCGVYLTLDYSKFPFFVSNVELPPYPLF